MGPPKLAYMPWYPKDWLADGAVRRMTYEQRGAYRELLDWQWVEGKLPAAPDDLADLLEIDPTYFQERIWYAIQDRFPLRRSSRRNRRLEVERKKAVGIWKARVKGGKRRWGKKIEGQAGHKLSTSSAQAGHHAEHVQSPIPIPSPSPSPKDLYIGAWPDELAFVRTILERGSAATLAPDLYLDKDGKLDLAFLKRIQTRWAPDAEVVWDEELEKYLDWLSRKEGRHTDRRRGFQNWLDRAKKGWPDDDGAEG